MNINRCFLTRLEASKLHLHNYTISHIVYTITVCVGIGSVCRVIGFSNESYNLAISFVELCFLTFNIHGEKPVV